eukprot:Pgem_evm1s7521
MEEKRHILIALDGSHNSQYYFDFMIKSIAFDKTADDLTICTVVSTKSDPKTNLQKGQTIVDDYVRQAQKLNFKNVESHVATSEEPQKAIVAAALKINATLVVTGARGLSGLKSLMLGSVSQYIVANCHCPVIVVKITEDQKKETFDLKDMLE